MAESTAAEKSLHRRRGADDVAGAKKSWSRAEAETGSTSATME